MSRDHLARRERRALCDLALVLGEDAPTLCGDWTSKDLVTHLLVREHSPVGAAGLLVSPLSWVTEREMARIGKKDFPILVERLRKHGLTPYSIRPVDKAFNTLEYFVHHEDLRRAQPHWEPRTLDPGDEQTLWSATRGLGLMTLRRAGVPVQVRRSDTGDTKTLRPGGDPVVVSGLPSEVCLFLFGRDQLHDLDVDGPSEQVERLRETSLGV